MARSNSIVLAGSLALLAFLSTMPSTTAAFVVEYCSNQNTNPEGQTWHSDWQSNGFCTGKCGAYAFAVIQYKDCWCSNYIPEAQDDTSDCDGTCPGFPSEICGSNSGDRFVYIPIDGRKPSGTKGASEPTQVSTTSSPSVPSSDSSTRPTSTRISTSSKPTTLQTSTSVQPVTSNRVVTSGGLVVTETIILTPSNLPGATASPSLTAKEGSGTNVAAIAGGVVGGVVGLAAIVGGIFFILWRRRKQNQAGDEQDPSGIARNTSTMSKAGLIRGEKPTTGYPPPINTNLGSNRRTSRMMGDSESISPVSGSDRRSSRPYIFDQRLNPSAIMNFDNASRGSFASMDDSRDYGRTLNVRNPDP